MITIDNTKALEIALDNLRTKRNKLLADSDYIVLADSSIPSVKKSQWMTYRTNLRNITQGLSTVEQINAVVFPVAPRN